MKNNIYIILSKLFKLNKKYIKEFFSKVWEILLKPEMMILPGQLAFFVIISIVPIVSIITLIGNLAGISLEAITELLNRIFTSIQFELIIPNLFGQHLSLNYIIVIIVTCFIASKGANSIIVASNQIYGIKQGNTLRRMFKSMILTLLICVLYIFVLIVPLLGNKIMASFDYFHLKNIIDPLLTIVRGPITWLIVYLFLKSIYVLAPDKPILKKGLNIGALFSTVFWIIATYLYSIWINNFNSYDMYYGSLSSLAILMLWVYYLCYIFVIGLCLNVKIENETIEKSKNMNNKKFEIN